MTAYFVTATGTDTGKTYVTAALLRHYRARDRKVRALKPIVSGFPGADMRGSDCGVLLAALGEPVNDETIAAISPWRFAAPLSPDMAAVREGRVIPYTELIAWCRGEIALAREATLFIEGVGGVMVPLDARRTVLDWMADLRLPIVLVAGGYLGTISHTLTALAALATRGLAPLVLVLNETGPLPVPLADTVAAIARFAPGLPIVCLARDGDISPLARLLDGTGDAIGS